MRKKYIKTLVKIKREITTIKTNSFSPTFMEKEIEEQPQIVENLLKRYYTQDGYIMINFPLCINKVVLIASGSSYNCATIISGIMREYAHINAVSLYSSEVCGISSFQPDDDTLYIFISQSGETTDTLNALRMIKKNTQNTLSVTNNEFSSIYDEGNYKLLVYSGCESSIAATKSLTAQIVSLILLTAKIMQSKKIDIQPLINTLKQLPQLITETIKNRKTYKKISKNLSGYKNITLLGTGIFYPLAKEGALKIRELSYINTNAYPLGEFLHGHIAALNNKTALIAILPESKSGFCVEVINKIKKDFSPFLLSVSNFKNCKIDEYSNYSLIYENEDEITMLFATLVTLQLISFEIARRLKRNIDKPRGLKKIVKS